MLPAWLCLVLHENLGYDLVHTLGRVDALSDSASTLTLGADQLGLAHDLFTASPVPLGKSGREGNGQNGREQRGRSRLRGR